MNQLRREKGGLNSYSTSFEPQALYGTAALPGYEYESDAIVAQSGQTPGVPQAIQTPLPHAGIDFSLSLQSATPTPVPSSSGEPTVVGPWVAVPPTQFYGGFNAVASMPGATQIVRTGKLSIKAQVCYSGSAGPGNVSNGGIRSISIMLLRNQQTYALATSSVIPSATDTFDTVLNADAIGVFIPGDLIYITTTQNSGLTLYLSPGPKTLFMVHGCHDAADPTVAN